MVIAYRDHQILQKQLLQQGSALIYDMQPHSTLEEWWELEDKERLQSFTYHASDAEECLNSWCLIAGQVHDVSVKGKKAYLNFSDDWKRDFTIYIEGDTFFQIGEDVLKELNGRFVTVRGHVDWYYGPRIVLHNKEMMHYAR